MPNPIAPKTQPGDASQNSALDGLKEAGLQADTFVRNAANVATFGLADKAEAAADALFDHTPGDWLQHYKASLNDQVARTLYDSSHRPIAQTAGRIAGVGLAAADAAALGENASAALPSQAKGLLGEVLSAGKTVMEGDFPVRFQIRRKLNNGKTTIVDHETLLGKKVEAKFGPTATLKPNQRYAQKQWGPDYRVDWWLPHHVGDVTGLAGGFGGLLSSGLYDTQPPDTDSDSTAADNSPQQIPKAQ